MRCYLEHVKNVLQNINEKFWIHIHQCYLYFIDKI